MLSSLLLLALNLLPLSTAQGNPIDISACLRTCIRKYNSKCDDLDVLCICKLSSTGPFLTQVSTCYASNCDDFLTIADLLTAIEPLCQLDGYPIPDAAISSAEAIGASATGYGSGASESATSELSYTLFAPIPGAASSTTMFLGETSATTMHLGETSAMSTPTASVIPLASLLSSIPGSTTATATATILPLVGSSTIATVMSMTTASSTTTTTTSPTSTVGNATPFSGAPGSLIVSGILGLIPLVVLMLWLL